MSDQHKPGEQSRDDGAAGNGAARDEGAAGPEAAESGFDAVAAAAEFTDAAGDYATDAGRPSEAGAQIEELENEIADLGGLLQKADEDKLRAEARAANAEAEIERAKARLAKESARETGERVRKVLLSFLEVFDDLDRALDAANASGNNPAILDGIELVRSRFLKELAKHGVERMESEGAEFDPNLHDAMTTVPVTDPAQHNLVMHVIRPGYTIGDEVLRPAGVAVGKAQ